MKRVLLILGVLVLVGLSSCHSNMRNKVLLSREFPTMSWERFDYVKNTMEIDKPVCYNLELDVTFDASYSYNYFSMSFAVFDKSGNPLRAKDYQFNLKDRDGIWKSDLVEGQYHFRFPINNELTLNEPDTYTFQLENRMPITPLLGIKEISLISK